MKKISRFLSIAILAGSVNLRAAQDLQTVDQVDLNQYIGKWHEVASIPQSFQKKCVKSTTAEYSFGEKDLVSVINSCTKENGDVNIAEGAARVEDRNTNAKLKVTFVKLFGWVFTLGGNYWIIDLDSHYQYAVVGDPTREYAWILSRTPSLDMKTLEGIHQRLKNNKYDTCKILTSIQDGGFSERKPLCSLFQ